MSSNFSFLDVDFPALSQFGKKAVSSQEKGTKIRQKVYHFRTSWKRFFYKLTIFLPTESRSGVRFEFRFH